MYTLRIEHAISDFDEWSAVFGRFAERRSDGGVVDCRVSRPLDDPAYVMVDLDFATEAQAHAFHDFLRTQVWSNAPVLHGEPRARVVQLVGS